MLEDGTLLDEATTSFEIKQPYTPPPPEAATTLIPTSSTTTSTGAKIIDGNTLSTQDGRISMTFAEGSVLSQMQVAIRSYPVTQLPAAPAGYQLGATCFRVDGLSGLLLAKEATLKVQYTAADVEKAGGNPAKLALARWSETDGKWNIIETNLEKNIMTLSASTNQLSLWAVMVSEAAPGVSPLIIISAAAGVIVVCLIVYFIVRRKKRA